MNKATFDKSDIQEIVSQAKAILQFELPEIKATLAETKITAKYFWFFEKELTFKEYLDRKLENAWFFDYLDEKIKVIEKFKLLNDREIAVLELERFLTRFNNEAGSLVRSSLAKQITLDSDTVCWLNCIQLALKELNGVKQ